MVQANGSAIKNWRIWNIVPQSSVILLPCTVETKEIKAEGECQNKTEMV